MLPHLCWQTITSSALQAENHSPMIMETVFLSISTKYSIVFVGNKSSSSGFYWIRWSAETVLSLFVYIYGHAQLIHFGLGFSNVNSTSKWYIYRIPYVCELLSSERGCRCPIAVFVFSLCAVIAIVLEIITDYRALHRLQNHSGLNLRGRFSKKRSFGEAVCFYCFTFWCQWREWYRVLIGCKSTQCRVYNRRERTIRLGFSLYSNKECVRIAIPILAVALFCDECM